MWFRRSTGAALALAFLGAAAATWMAFAQPRVIFETDSEFGHIFVTEGRNGIRSLYFDEGTARQGAVRLGEPGHLEIEYTRAGIAGLALTPSVDRVLFVGLGVGAMPMYTRTVWPETDIDVVEIDSAVVGVAQRFFGFVTDERMRVHVADGRAFIENTPLVYDVIVLDAYSDTGIPEHLTTLEFLEAVRARLDPEGVVVANLWTASELHDAMLATFAEVFASRALINVGRGSQVILIAGGEGIPLGHDAVMTAVRRVHEERDLGFDLERMVRSGHRDVPGATAPILRDPG